MKTLRRGVFKLASLALSFALLTPALAADVRSIDPWQTLPRPPGSAFTYSGQDIAIDGGHIIVLGGYEGGQQALLYRRNSSNGQWVYRRALVTWTGPFVRSGVAMKNGIAAVQFGDQVSLFEMSGGDYVPSPSTAPIRHHGGLAISGNRVLVGGNNCDYDAVVYQKNTAGSWAITGRLDDNQGQCFGEFDSYAVELHYDYALLLGSNASQAQAWRRNGSALEWVPAGSLALLPEGSTSTYPFALQGATAVGSHGHVWRRSGTSTWTLQGIPTSVDHDQSFGFVGIPVYRDGVLMTIESGVWAFPRVYLEASPGRFEHVASLFTTNSVNVHDVSGRTAVVSNTRFDVQVFNLPSQMRAPVPIVNDFEDRDISGFTFSGGQFALATRGSDDVLVQSSTNGRAVAVLSDSDWTDHQRVEADITPTYGTGGWVGLVARYIDADNYYYTVLRPNSTYGIYKRVNGVDTSLYEANFYNQMPASFRASMRVKDNRIDVFFSFQQGAAVTDNSLTHGRGGVVTFLSRADFDDVHVAGTDPYLLFSREWGFGGSDSVSGMEELSGDWQVIEISDGEESGIDGLAQRDKTVSGVAIIGTPVANQDINARMRLDAFGTSTQGAWFGLLARYEDARNHYYVTMRSTGQVQIRKIVDGVITVLGTANLTAVPGRIYDVRFLVINDQLQLYVDHVLVATAHDGSIAQGKYGLATYRAAARYETYYVLQP